MTEQLKAEDLAGLSPWQIDQKREAGQLEELTAALAAPVSHVLPYTVPTDPETGRPVVQLSAAEVKALTPEGKVEALNRGRLAAYMAGDNDPARPESERPVRAAFQFGEAHVAEMAPEEIARFRAEGRLVDYDTAHPDGPPQPARGAQL